MKCLGSAIGSHCVPPQFVKSFALLASDCRAERRYNFSVLICEHGSQVELEPAAFNVPNNRWSMRPQPCSQILRSEFVVRYFERRRLHARARQRTSSNLSAAFA